MTENEMIEALRRLVEDGVDEVAACCDCFAFGMDEWWARARELGCFEDDD